jgi:hypothetical protein
MCAPRALPGGRLDAQDDRLILARAPSTSSTALKPVSITTSGRVTFLKPAISKVTVKIEPRACALADTAERTRKPATSRHPHKRRLIIPSLMTNSENDDELADRQKRTKTPSLDPRNRRRISGRSSCAHRIRRMLQSGLTGHNRTKP